MDPKQANYVLLYVEDDPFAREHITMAISLKFPNARVLAAENGRVGLDLFIEHRPDLVLTDIKMPVMDGITMTAEIRRLDPEVPVAVISAYGDTKEYGASTEELGIDYCVTKPVDHKILFATIEKCFGTIAIRN